MTLCVLGTLFFITVFCISWSIRHGFARKEDTLSLIFQVIGLILEVLAIILTVVQPKSHFSVSTPNINNNEIEDNNSIETQEKGAVKVNRCGFWNSNHKWIILFLIALLLFLSAFCYNIHEDRKLKERDFAAIEQHRQDSIRQDSIQRRFDDLVNEYNNRMEQELKFEYAYELLVDDSIMLVQIIQMLDENPNLKEDADYREQFKNRAGEAIDNIRYAVYVLELPHDDSVEYCKQINRIEQMMYKIDGL